MRNKILLLIIATLSFCPSPAQERGKIDIKGYRILMDSTMNTPVEPKSYRIISKYKPLMERTMLEVVGVTDAELRSSRPESLLSNFTADAMLEYAKKHGGADFALTNFGGIRAAMPAGNVRRYDVFSIFPFENYLVLVDVKGSAVLELFNYFASHNPEVISGNVRFVINDKSLESLTINGEPVSGDRNYKIATLDFILTGGDNLSMLKNNISVVETGVLLRDVVFEQIKESMKRSGKIASKLDNRVVIKNR